MGLETSDTSVGYDQADNCYRLHHRWVKHSLSTAIVQAVAIVTNTPVTDVDPLYETVNPDTLDRLYEPMATDGPRQHSGHTTFTLHDCEITVFADGRIELRPSADG